MKNRALVHDYLTRSHHRLAAIEVLFERESWPDVVRESQEVVELAIKALLRAGAIEIPRMHDVGRILPENLSRFEQWVHPHVTRLAAISKDLRRDRELAFYGSEDLTPSEFYSREDAVRARDSAVWVVDTLSRGLGVSAPKSSAKR